jgi:predicted DNA-binding protein
MTDKLNITDPEQLKALIPEKVVRDYTLAQQVEEKIKEGNSRHAAIESVEIERNKESYDTIKRAHEKHS